MTVIAMTREMGTLGKDVAAGLAEAIGLEVVHHELVERHIAERLNLGESAVHRFLEGKTSLWDRWNIDKNKVSRYTAQEVLALAQKDNVLIRGWGAAQLLRDVSHVLCVRICAPMSKRIDEMVDRLQISDRHVVRREIDQNDDAHSRAIQRQFGEDWADPVHYDIVLNTAFIHRDECVAVLQKLAQNPAYQPTQASRSKLADKLIEARVRDVIDGLETDSPVGVNLSVAVDAGEVTLTGVVGRGGSIDEAVSQIGKIEGVTGVQNGVMFVEQRFGV
jgi:cytidylate kinase